MSDLTYLGDKFQITLVRDLLRAAFFRVSCFYPGTNHLGLGQCR